MALHSFSCPESQLTTLFVIVLRGELQPSIKCVVKEIALHSVTVREMFPFNLQSMKVISLASGAARHGISIKI